MLGRTRKGPIKSRPAFNRDFDRQVSHVHLGGYRKSLTGEANFLIGWSTFLVTSVFLCVIRSEMIIYKAYLGQKATADSIRSLQGRGALVAIDSWSEIRLTYEKYDTDDLQRNWTNIVKAPDGLQTLDKVPADGSWGILYEN